MLHCKTKRIFCKGECFAKKFACEPLSPKCRFFIFPVKLYHILTLIVDYPRVPFAQLGILVGSMLTVTTFILHLLMKRSRQFLLTFWASEHTVLRKFPATTACWRTCLWAFSSPVATDVKRGQKYSLPECSARRTSALGDKTPTEISTSGELKRRNFRRYFAYVSKCIVYTKISTLFICK